MRSFVVALFALGAALVVAPVVAREPMDAVALGAKIAVATGPTPAAERERWEVAYPDGTAVETYARRGEDDTLTTRRAGLEERSGTLGGRAWAVTPNGLTRAGHPTPSPATAADRRVVATAVRRIVKPLDAWELQTTYGSGNVALDDADPRTFLVMRHVDRRLGGDETVTTYADFRTDAGYTHPYAARVTDGAPEDDERRTLAAYDPHPAIADAELAIPRSGACPFTFPPGEKRVVLPAQIIDREIYVRLTIGGRGYDFQVDTGADGLFIGDDVATRLGLPAHYRTSVSIDSRFSSRTVTVPDANLGPLAVHDLVMRTVPPLPLRARIAPAGLLGFDLLACVDLRIDYGARTVDAIEPSALDALARGAMALDADLGYGVPLVAAAVDDRPGTEFIFDTGAAGSGIFFARFAEKHEAALRRDLSRTGVMRGVGGGGFATEPVTVARFAFGGRDFHELTFVRARSRGALNLIEMDGLIGRDVLANFVVTTDYPRERIVLEPPGG